eukprot:gene15846-38479_t
MTFGVEKSFHPPGAAGSPFMLFRRGAVGAAGADGARAPQPADGAVAMVWAPCK